jgi:DNA-binding transcriptional ArsR family regulator
MQLDPAALQILASPRRQEILRLTWNDFVPVSDIHRAIPGVTMGAISLQLGQLLQAGLIERRAEGKQRLYRANRQALGPFRQMLEQMWSDALWRLKIVAEMEAARRGPRPAHRPSRKSRL